MNAELIAILDGIERDKGIKAEVLISAIESALVIAVKKSLPQDAQEQDISAKIDRQTGGCQIFADGKSVHLKDMGRIAIQTAKQVVIQKLREMERDTVFEDCQDKVGKILTGSVHLIRKDNVIMDIEGVQALLPKSEQLPKDNYRQGDLVRAFVIEVRKTSKVAPIVLSRTHPGFLARLFELEVPEIYEGIVQVKGCVRDAGDRAKIAVWSTDPKVDSVGACVGKRGVRVKNIVKELKTEKIDIIRYAENPKDFVSAALAPAKVSNVMLDPNTTRMDVVVPDDQLSLAIGSRGQNVRLASKLTGWSIDIYSESEFEEKKKIPFTDVDAITEEAIEKLQKAGIVNLPQMANTPLDILQETIGAKKEDAQRILESARRIMLESAKGVDKKQQIASVATGEIETKSESFQEEKDDKAF